MYTTGNNKNLTQFAAPLGVYYRADQAGVSWFDAFSGAILLTTVPILHEHTGVGAKVAERLECSLQPSVAVLMARCAQVECE